MSRSPIQEIISKENSKLKLVKSLHEKSGREEHKLFILEGETLVLDALRAGLELLWVFSISKENSIRDLNDQIEFFEITEALMKGISTTSSAPPVLAVAKQTQKTPTGSVNKILFCENIRDPGNLGSIIRSAFASGVELVCLSENCADLYNPKTVRSSMGAMFQGCIQSNIGLEELVKKYPEHEIIATSSYAEKSYKDIEKPSGFILLIGNETEGLSEAALRLADTKIEIPMQNNIESLNVVAAASLVLFELKS